MKHALILGITGQDGSYLSEILLDKNYKVWGIVRRSSNFNTQRIEHIRERISLQYGDITDFNSINNILKDIEKEEPQVLEIYNLAAQSHVGISFDMPYYTGQTDALGTLNILEAVRKSDISHKIKFYQASTSELFGKVAEIPQTECTPFYPRSPYACAKLYSYWIVKNYREAYGIYTCNGILFNHSSPRRPKNFILRKITSSVKNILDDNTAIMTIGNLNSQRDIGFAKEYCEGMWLMLQQEQADDFVLSTGKTYKIREMIEIAFRKVEINIRWEGEGIDEIGYDSDSDRVLVKVDPKYFRPCEVDLLIGDSSKANNVLNWYPEYGIEELIGLMLEEED